MEIADSSVGQEDQKQADPIDPQAVRDPQGRDPLRPLHELEGRASRLKVTVEHQGDQQVHHGHEQGDGPKGAVLVLPVKTRARTPPAGRT